MKVCMALLSWSTGNMLVSIDMQGKAADISSLCGTDNISVKGLFISRSIVGDLDVLSCTQVMPVGTYSVGEPGLLLERFAMCTQKRQRKGSLGL